MEAWETYKKSLAPFAGVIGEGKGQYFVLLDSDFNVLFKTEKVWDRHRANYSRIVKAKMAEHKYDDSKLSDNFFSTDTLEQYIDFVELRFKFKTN